MVSKEEWSRWVWPSPDRDGTVPMLRTDVLYGFLSDLPTATFHEACSWSTVPMATFPEVCFLELSYVNVPTVNLKPYSMNVAIPTDQVRYSAALFENTALLVRTTCTSFWI